MNTKEIWKVDFNPSIGAEVAKQRPSIIVSDDSVGKLPLRVIVPITGWQEKFNAADWLVKVVATPENGLTKDSAADCFQVKSVAKERFVQKLGVLSDEDFEKVKTGLRNVLDL